MVDPLSGERGTTSFWVGLAAAMDSMEAVLADEKTDMRDRVRLPNDPRALAKLLKRWHKQYGFIPAMALFCAGEGRPWLGNVLQWLVSRGWDVVLVSGRETGEADPAPGTELEAAWIASAAMRHPSASQRIGVRHLQALKLEHLRDRRMQLVALRKELYEEGSLRQRRFEQELAREFERLDRRHVQVIDKIILRLDTLIQLQMQNS